MKCDSLLRMKFYELAIGARFIFRERKYQKIAMGMAENEERLASIFLGETVVTADGEPLLLPPEEAARWKPDERHWSEYLARAPGAGPKMEDRKIKSRK